MAGTRTKTWGDAAHYDCKGRIQIVEESVNGRVLLEELDEQGVHHEFENPAPAQGLKPSAVFRALARHTACRRWLKQSVLTCIADRMGQTETSSLDLLSKWDQDRSGTLRWPEFQLGCLSIGVKAHFSELQLAWQAMDQNHDGMLDYGEINSALDGAMAVQVSSSAQWPAHRIVRKRLRSVIDSQVFNVSVLVLVVLNCISMAAEDPLCEAVHEDMPSKLCSGICSHGVPVASGWSDHTCSGNRVLFTSMTEVLCLAAFTIELLMKLSVHGIRYDALMQ